MKQNGGTRYVPGYDLFKLIVAVILTVVLIMLLLRESGGRPATLEASPTPTVTKTIQPTFTSTPTMTHEPTLTPTVTSTASPEIIVTETKATEITPTEIPATETPPVPDPNGCPANPTHIQVGVTVRVLDWLNFRTGPGLQYTIQHTNRPGTELEVIDGPVCTVKGGDPPRAYLWWKLRMKDGREGWSAEAPLNFPNYFLEPIR
ncbi:MAG: SH3 domain-containing protein [Chloroflexi bacterium]|nr:SH3 domain-containing protein [Chloroflexota bacterium]